jgi:UDP-N-acetylglucosamine acyltransferase
MISNLASVHPKAEIGKNVTIEAFAVVEANVVIGDNTWIGSNATIMSGSIIGSNCKIFPTAVVGAEPQDLKYKGEDTKAVIGDHVTIRECVTVNRGTTDKWETRVGDHTLLMAYSHIGHDSFIGKHCILANQCGVSGHVVIDDYATIEGQCGIGQFVRIGSYTFIGGMSAIRQNVPPFVKAARHPLSYVGINSIGMKRRGVSEEDIKRAEEIYKKLFIHNQTIGKGIEDVIANVADSEVKKQIVEFIENSPKGIIKSPVK